MKIGIDIRLWNETGVGRYIRNLVENLYSIDEDNSYVLFALKKDLDFLRTNFLKWKIVEANIRWHSFSEQRNLAGIIEKEGLDLIHFPYFSVPVNYKRPFIVTMHDVTNDTFSTGRASTLPLPLYFAKKIAYRYVVSKALSNSVAVIVPSNSVKDSLLKIKKVNPRKIYVTYEGSTVLSGSNKEILSELGISRKKYFLYVGNAYPHKNLERLAEAYLMFASARPGVKLVLSGKKDFFHERLRDAGVIKANGDSIVFAQDLSDADLSTLYKNSLSFISPSLAEGFALPALEAMESGVSIILSNIPTFKEICRDVPLTYFNPKDIADIRRALEDVFTFPSNEVKNHIQLGKILAKSYSWRKMAEETLRIYEGNPSTNLG